MSEVISFFKNSFDAIYRIWEFSLFRLGEHPITVSNIFIGIVFTYLGYRLSRKIRSLVGTYVVTQLGLGPAEKDTVQNLTFYFSLLITTLFSLNMANVPLTAFTFVGGALAVGLGLGGQKIADNLMSGVILMMERPVKVGDMIELGELQGVVEHIGARSTEVRSFTNRHIIVPNSTLLQNNVINWTMSDDVVMLSVRVGVVYGSPVEKVREQIKRCIEEEPKTLNRPEPRIFFEDFGNSALVFNFYFGVRLKNYMERLQVESDIRFRIYAAFRDAGITIAFPQRDVHLDVKTPMEIKVLRESRSANPQVFS